MTKIENVFANKEINAFRFCENLEKIISQIQALNIIHNETFWKTVQSILLKNKKSISWRINLTEENDSFLTNNEKVAKEMNNFFVDAVKNFNIPNYESCVFLAENLN